MEASPDLARRLLDLLAVAGPQALAWGALRRLLAGDPQAAAALVLLEAEPANADMRRRVAAALLSRCTVAELQVLIAELRGAGPALRSRIEAGDGALIQGSGHVISAPAGPVEATTRAGRGGRIIGSPIVISGAPALAPAPAPPPPAGPDAVDLELSIARAEGGQRAEARFTRPDSQAEVSLPPAPLQLDQSALLGCWPDAEAYGVRLSADLFAAPGLRDLTLQALAVAQALRAPLRLRLRLDPFDAALCAVRWETLRHPASGDPLLTSQQLWLARALGSADWAPVELAQRGRLRALALVSAPSDLVRYRLPAIDVAAEVDLARAALGGFETSLLGPGSASVSQLGAALRAGCDLLYLVAHGALVAGRPRLWLEREGGAAAVVDGGELALRIRELRRKPLLAVLISCQSAGQGAADAALALGPQLVAAGIPAVVAMQGQLTMATAARFTPALTQALAADGSIDRAMGEARTAVRERPDWWVPVLFTRLREGRIWR